MLAPAGNYWNVSGGVYLSGNYGATQKIMLEEMYQLEEQVSLLEF